MGAIYAAFAAEVAAIAADLRASEQRALERLTAARARLDAQLAQMPQRLAEGDAAADRAADARPT